MVDWFWLYYSCFKYDVGIPYDPTTKPNEKFIFIGNQVKALIEAIRTYHLIFDTINHLDLFHTLYVPYVSRNLVSLLRFDSNRYSFKFGNECFNLFKLNHFICFDTLYDGLYKFKLDNLFVECLFVGKPRSLRFLSHS